jgi:hypothetical protein
MVNSLASCVVFDCFSCFCLICFGLVPVSTDFASSFASPPAATGLPWPNLRSSASAFSMAACVASVLRADAPPEIDPAAASWSVPKASSARGAT